MAQFRKLKPAQMEVGRVYVAYSGRNKMLSSNGACGRLVKLVSKNGDNIKVMVLGMEEETAITNVSAREDAWVYSPDGADIDVKLNSLADTEFPKFSPRMHQEGWLTKTFKFDESEMFTSSREGEAGFNIPLLRHRGDTIKPETGQAYVNNFRMSWIVPAFAPEWRVPRAERMGLGAIELPLPKKPVPPEHAADIDALMPLLTKMVKEHTSDNVSFIKVADDLKKHSHHKNRACHMDMQRGSDFNVKYVLTLGSNNTKASWVKGHASKERELEYINYLANHSPYSDAIITKDAEFILEYGYVIDASFPSRIVVGACFATRQLWEKPFRVEAFTELMLNGVQPAAAFMFACQCSEFKNGKAKFGMGGGDHNNFQSSQVSDKCMINFMKHSPESAGVPYRHEPSTSSEGGVDGMWSRSFGTQSSVYKKLAAIKGANSNPTMNALSVDEVMERAADIIDDWLGVNGFS